MIARRGIGARLCADYAAVIASVGIDTNEAIRIVQAALTASGTAVPASS